MSDQTATSVPTELHDAETRPVITPRHILVVDDKPANLIAVEAALAPLRRRIVSASSGSEALARLLDEDFALILLDVQMPGMDGFETAALIRGRERTKHVPIIFVTAHEHDEAAILRAYQLGAVDFLYKPVQPEVLRAKADVFVRLQERTEQLAAERMEHEFENRRRDYEAAALRRERDLELAAKEELARLNETLALSDRRKDSFIAILAHELRNPLAPMRTCVDLMRSGSPDTSQMVDIVDRQTTLLTRLIDDLLDLSRIKADKIELRPERIDLVEVVQAAITTSRPSIDERQHALVVEAPSTRIDVVVDSVRFAQVLSNLLTNAARYTPRGGRIDVWCGLVDDAAVVRVTDTGLGIPKELHDTIFDMFVQERVGSDGSGGLGLGLALARRLVDLHGGSISVSSEGRGHGSTFEVRIPRSDATVLVPRKRTRDMQPLKRPAKPLSLRTVVIDDNDDARELLSHLLRARGCEVFTASDGLEGLGLIREQQPDVALVDLGLPGMDGIGLVERLRADCPHLKTRLIALTGYGDAADRERTRRAGFHVHLVKPASASEVVAALAEIDE